MTEIGINASLPTKINLQYPNMNSVVKVFMALLLLAAIPSQASAAYVSIYVTENGVTGNSVNILRGSNSSNVAYFANANSTHAVDTTYSIGNYWWQYIPIVSTGSYLNKTYCNTIGNSVGAPLNPFQHNTSTCTSYYFEFKQVQPSTITTIIPSGHGSVSIYDNSVYQGIASTENGLSNMVETTTSYGHELQLTAQPANGYKFEKWCRGSCSTELFLTPYIETVNYPSLTMYAYFVVDNTQVISNVSGMFNTDGSLSIGWMQSINGDIEVKVNGNLKNYGTYNAGYKFFTLYETFTTGSYQICVNTTCISKDYVAPTPTPTPVQTVNPTPVPTPSAYAWNLTASNSSGNVNFNYCAPVDATFYLRTPAEVQLYNTSVTANSCGSMSKNESILRTTYGTGIYRAMLTSSNHTEIVEFLIGVVDIPKQDIPVVVTLAGNGTFKLYRNGAYVGQITVSTSYTMQTGDILIINNTIPTVNNMLEKICAASNCTTEYTKMIIIPAGVEFYNIGVTFKPYDLNNPNPPPYTPPPPGQTPITPPGNPVTPPTDTSQEPVVSGLNRLFSAWTGLLSGLDDTLRILLFIVIVAICAWKWSTIGAGAGILISAVLGAIPYYIMILMFIAALCAMYYKLKQPVRV